MTAATPPTHQTGFQSVIPTNRPLLGFPVSPGLHLSGPLREGFQAQSEIQRGVYEGGKARLVFQLMAVLDCEQRHVVAVALLSNDG